MLGPYANESLTDFSVAENRSAMLKALDHVASEFGKNYPLLINGEEIVTDNKITSINPSNLDQIIGYVSSADQSHADKAMDAALRAFETWKHKTFEQRARYLFKAAAILRRKKHEFSAWMVYEAGKTWAEADADTAEAIDFLEYYAHDAVRLGQQHELVRIPGEDNELYYTPLGVGFIIPPWNFPLAILCGMTVAAIVTGNTVLLKPAYPTSVIGAKFVELMREAGIPDGVLNFIPGDPAEIGDYLVDHPKTRFVSFTGSRQTGVRIYNRASQVHEGQIWLKRVIAEMGGKDAIVVDNQVDVEEVSQAIVASAFFFAGQKCSACSRAILHKDVYDQVVQRVTELTNELTVGPSHEQSSSLGPVVDDKAYNKVLSYLEIGKQEGKLMAGGAKAEGNGYYIQPTVFADVAPDARLSKEEIFGPVLAITKADSFEQAIDYANDTDYGLTGAVFSQNRDRLEYARTHYEVGNLYLNRKCTGALVGVHPFGGFNMSGTDSKAGGRDYLLLFTQAKSVSERL